MKSTGKIKRRIRILGEGKAACYSTSRKGLDHKVTYDPSNGHFDCDCEWHVYHVAPRRSRGLEHQRCQHVTRFINTLLRRANQGENVADLLGVA